MRNRILSLLCLFSFIFTGIGPVHAKELKLGVTAPRGVLKASAQWSEFASYLGTRINTPVKLVALTPDKILPAVAAKSVDFLLVNPVTSTIMIKKYGMKPVATMKKKSGSQFGGVIIANKSKGITKSSDLKGKKVMAYKFRASAAAYVFQVYHVNKQGIDPFKDFAVFKEAKKQDDIVLAVKAGVVDAGFIKSGLLEAMAKEGKIKLDDVTIVDKKSDSLSDLHSTILYPQWYLVADRKVPASLVAKVKNAALSLSAADPAAKKAKIAGFVAPLKLDELIKTLKALHMPPYN